MGVGLWIGIVAVSEHTHLQTFEQNFDFSQSFSSCFCRLPLPICRLQVALGIRQLEYTRPVTTYTSRPSGTGTYEKQCIDVIQLRHAHTPESTGSWNAVSVDCDCSLPLVDYHRIGYELDAKKIMIARLLAMHGQLRPIRVAVMSKPYIICWAVSA